MHTCKITKDDGRKPATKRAHADKSESKRRARVKTGKGGTQEPSQKTKGSLLFKKVLIEETKTATIEHNQDHDTPFKSEPEDIEMTDNDQTWGTRCLGRRK